MFFSFREPPKIIDSPYLATASRKKKKEKKYKKLSLNDVMHANPQMVKSCRDDKIILNEVMVWILWWPIYVWKWSLRLHEQRLHELNLISPIIVVLQYAHSHREEKWLMEYPGYSVCSGSQITSGLWFNDIICPKNTCEVKCYDLELTLSMWITLCRGNRVNIWSPNHMTFFHCSKV